MNCVWFELLCRVPVAGLRLKLSRRHVRHCPRCLRASESAESLPPVLIQADRLPADLDLRPAVRARLNATPAFATAARRSWRWAYAAAALALLLLAGLWTLLFDRPARPAAPLSALPSLRVRVSSAKIADQPARIFQVQSRDPDRAIYWIARNNPRS